MNHHMLNKSHRKKYNANYTEVRILFCSPIKEYKYYTPFFQCRKCCNKPQ